MEEPFFLRAAPLLGGAPSPGQGRLYFSFAAQLAEAKRRLSHISFDRVKLVCSPSSLPALPASCPFNVGRSRVPPLETELRQVTRLPPGPLPREVCPPLVHITLRASLTSTVAPRLFSRILIRTFEFKTGDCTAGPKIIHFKRYGIVLAQQSLTRKRSALQCVRLLRSQRVAVVHPSCRSCRYRG